MNIKTAHRYYHFFYTYLIYLLLFYSFSIQCKSNNPKKLDSISKDVKIYIIKSYWHTGIILKIDAQSQRYIPSLNDFKEKKYADIGWGDEDFYQSDGFNLWLAAKAILVPTASVIRLEGFNSEIAQMLRWYDWCIEFQLDEKNYKRLCWFINNSFARDSSKKLITVSTRNNNAIKYYKSNLKYYLFRTCNTWVAQAFSAAGIDICSFGIITADDLYEEIARLGAILK